MLENRPPVRNASREGKSRVRSAVVFMLVLCCGGCAAAAPRDAAVADDADAEHDPAEPVNRAIFKANVAADHAVMKPVAQAYSDHVPEGVQKGIHNVVQNLKEPAVAVNDALQGNVKQAWQSVQRLAVNSTAGVAGIFDVADKLGIPPHKADFGQTLAVWGVGEGPFVELPLLGPSNARDTVGTVVDMAMNPLTFVGGAPATYAGVATGGANVVDTRAQHLHDLIPCCAPVTKTTLPAHCIYGSPRCSGVELYLVFRCVQIHSDDSLVGSGPIPRLLLATADEVIE